jgi:hypothetical protein
MECVLEFVLYNLLRTRVGEKHRNGKVQCELNFACCNNVVSVEIPGPGSLSLPS